MDDLYSTNNLVLASYLYANHCELVDFQQKFRIGQWTFESSPELQELLTNYEEKCASVDLIKYKLAERKLRSMILK